MMTLGMFCKRAAPSGAWSVAYAQALGADNSGWQGYTMRQVIPANTLSISGSKIRLRLVGPSSGASNILKAYLGHSGSGLSFDGLQQQVLIAASGSLTLGAGSSVVSDEVVLAIDKTRDLIFAVYFNPAGSSGVRQQQSGIAAGFNRAYSPGSTDNAAATTAVGGYTNTPSTIAMIDQIEVFA